MSILTAGDRVVHLLATHWRNSQADMARAVGCSQAALSKVATKKVEPGKRLLAKIAAHAEVNPEWLYSGRGKPIRPAANRVAVKSNQLPVLRHPCTQDGIGTATPTEYYPSESQYSAASCYWVEVQPTEWISSDASSGVLQHDLLLIDTDRSNFPDVAEFMQTLCVVRLTGRKTPLQFARVTYHGANEIGDPENVEAETFERTVRPDEIIVETVVRKRGSHLQVFERRMKRVNRRGHDHVVDLNPNCDYEPLSHVIGTDDVVGIVRLLARRTF